MGIQGNENSFFTWYLKVVVSKESKTHYCYFNVILAYLRTWFQFIFSKSARNDWLLKFPQSWHIMLYLVGVEFEKKSAIIKNFGRWCDILDIAILTSGVDILQKYDQSELYFY